MIQQSSSYFVAKFIFGWEGDDFVFSNSNSSLRRKSNVYFWTHLHIVRVSSLNFPLAFSYWFHPWSSLSDNELYLFLHGSSPQEANYTLYPDDFYHCGRCVFLIHWARIWILPFGLIFRGWYWDSNLLSHSRFASRLRWGINCRIALGLFYW